MKKIVIFSLLIAFSAINYVSKLDKKSTNTWGINHIFKLAMADSESSDCDHADQYFSHGESDMGQFCYMPGMQEPCGQQVCCQATSDGQSCTEYECDE